MGVKKHKSALRRFGSSDNGEHALASVIVWDLGDRDARSGKTSDLSDL